MDWKAWRAHFEAFACRPLPEVTPPTLDPVRHAALVKSLARFQLGESGEGRIAHDIDRATFGGIDDDYRACLKRFVAEEGRHARLLGQMVAAMGGTLPTRHWSERLFVHGRRLFGIRFKLLVLQAAEVVGLSCYAALAEALPESPMRKTLEQLCADERHHLAFHRDFFRSQRGSPVVQRLLWLLWWPLSVTGVALVLLDHRRTFEVFGIAPGAVWRQAWASIRSGAVFGGSMDRIQVIDIVDSMVHPR